MKDFFKKLFKDYYEEDIVSMPEPVVVPKTNRERLYEVALLNLNIDPTPKDEVNDEFACVSSLTTILRQVVPDFPLMTYTPNLLKQLQVDKRFKASTEFKEGNIIVSVTSTGNGSTYGHCGVISKGGKIMSNSSSTGLWADKYDSISWIERYSRKGGLALYIFEVL